MFCNKKTQLFWKRVKKCNSKTSSKVNESIDAETLVAYYRELHMKETGGFNDAPTLTTNRVYQIFESQSQCGYKEMVITASQISQLIDSLINNCA